VIPPLRLHLTTQGEWTGDTDTAAFVVGQQHVCTPLCNRDRSRAQQRANRAARPRLLAQLAPLKGVWSAEVRRPVSRVSWGISAP
jgi:hypothetical protein